LKKEYIYIVMIDNTINPHTSYYF